MKINFENLSLGVLTHKECWRDPVGIKTTGGFGIQVGEMSRYFARVVMLLPFEEKNRDLPGYIINVVHLQIIPLPHFNGTGLFGKLDFIIKLPRIFLKIWRAYPLCDIWQIRLPGYVGLLGILVHKLRGCRRPVFIWLGTDWPERIRESGNTLLRRGMARLATALIDWALKDIPTFALGELGNKYKHSNAYAHTTVSTVISSQNLAYKIRDSIASPPRLLFVGRLALEKGLPDLLDALHIADHKGLTLDLTIIGDGPERENLMKVVRRYGLQKLVHFIGYIPAGQILWQYYHQADIFILPALSEAQGKVLIEAMAAGLPVIATRAGGIPSVIKHSETGLLVKPHSPSDILNAIQTLLANTELRNRLANNALTIAREFTVEKQTEKLISQLADDLQELSR